MAKKEIIEIKEIPIIITTCDNCGDEIGKNTSGDYDGYRCSICGRQYCKRCHKTICTHSESLYLYVCKFCNTVGDNTLIEMERLLLIEEDAREKRFKLQLEWEKRSNPEMDKDGL
jgi:hypothetical protein